MSVQRATERAYLCLADGTCFEGVALGACGAAFGARGVALGEAVSGRARGGYAGGHQRNDAAARRRKRRRRLQSLLDAARRGFTCSTLRRGRRVVAAPFLAFPQPRRGQRHPRCAASALGARRLGD